MLTHRLAHITRRAMGERMARERWAIEAGFRPGCVGVLRTVAALEPVSQREVSAHLVLDPSDLVSLVDILDRAGLVRRRRDPRDRRRHSLEVTRAGREAVWRLEQISREVNEAVLAPLDPGEREALSHLLGRIVEHHTWIGPPSGAGGATGDAARTAGVRGGGGAAPVEAGACRPRGAGRDRRPARS